MGFWNSFKEEYRTERKIEPPPPPPDRREPRCRCDDDEQERTRFGDQSTRSQRETDQLRHESAELKQRLMSALRDAENVRRENQKLTVQLTERDEKLGETIPLVQELAAEVEKLSNELRVRRRAEPQTAGAEKFKKLCRYVRKHVHPDVAGDDKRLRALLGPICAELNAEIDRIDAA